MSTIYALLVGINDYLGGVNGLRGCVNDVKRMNEFLQLRTQGGEFEFKPLVLTSGDRNHPDEIKPTRQAVIDGFRNHLCQASPGDIAIFYYSGHGSQQNSPPELWHLEPDRLDETIVCYDSRTEGQWDLADKELGLLIAEVSRKKPHILVVLDSCHSGSGTRAPGQPGVRLTNSDKRERPLHTFEGYAQIKASQPDKQAASDWLVLPHGKHVVLAACRPEEVAAERFLGDNVHGLLSYYLLDTLQRANANLTYRDIFAHVGTLVRNQAVQQNPMIEATEVRQLQEPFLGGAVKPQPAYFPLNYSKAKSWWVIGGGAVNGIPAPVGNETTTLAVFNDTTDLANVSTMEDAVGWAKVTAVEPGISRVEFILKNGAKPNTKDGFKALVVSQPLPPISVWMQGDEAGLDLVRAALKTAGANEGPSLIVQELTAENRTRAAERAGHEIPAQVLAPLTLIARDGRYLIRRSDDAYPLMVPVEQGYNQTAARLAVERLEHVACWLQVAGLDNKTSALPPDAVSLELYAVNDDDSLGERIDTTGGTIRLEYRYQNGSWKQPRFKLRLSNNSDQRLYCALLNLTETFAIKTAGLLKGGGEWLKPKGQDGSEVWAYDGKRIPAGIKKQLLDQDVVTSRDILKLIVSTTELPATLLEREELGVTTRQTKSPAAPLPKSSLARLYGRVQTRALGSDAEPDEAITDWTASQITITIVHPRDGVDVPSAGDTASLSDVVDIEGHPALQASARLTTFVEGARDAGNLALPPTFRQHPEIFSPFAFSDFRDGAPGLSVLELNVEGDTHRQVTPEQPLLLQVAKPLAADEYVLPVAYDPETKLFLPLGGCARSQDHTTIRIERLPEPMSETRELGGTIKLFFHKVVAEKLGLDQGETARLAIAKVLPNGQVAYDDSPANLAARVAAAQRILLYIHGFIGDTRRMVASSKGLCEGSPNPTPTLAERYDLILAFDYENINTPIEETAVALKERLAACGLGAGHSKTVHIVAHSMGSLVARWFVEREAGYRVVQKVVFVGPPNAGSPWAKIQDLVLVGLGVAINGLAAVAWPPSIIPTLIGTLSALVGGVEKVDVTLDQMKPDSSFYKMLEAGEDPGVPYQVIAGNTRRIYADAAASAQVESSLVRRLTSKRTRDNILSLAFFGQPNDIAVSVQSMVRLPAFSQVQPPVEIACDHLSYFTTEVGLRALAETLP